MKKIVMATFVAATALFSACNDGAPKAHLQTEVDTLSYEMGIVMSAERSNFEAMLAQQGSDSAYVDEFIKGYIAGMKSGDDKKKMAYYMGVQAGMQTKMQLPMIEQQVFQGDSTKKISLKNFIAGFTNFAPDKVVLKNDSGKPLDRESANKHIMEYMFGKQKKESAEFMAAKAKEAGVKELTDGIYYKVLTPGSGDKRCTVNDSITVKYEGKLPTGNVFDTSERQANGTVTMPLARTIEGWKKALPQMPVGATWELYIPYELGYGEAGSGPIPPFSALIFKITLVDIK